MVTKFTVRDPNWTPDLDEPRNVHAETPLGTFYISRRNDQEPWKVYTSRSGDATDQLLFTAPTMSKAKRLVRGLIHMLVKELIK